MKFTMRRSTQIEQTPRVGTVIAAPDDAPGWAVGLRQLYTTVAAEPVPADMGDLLARINLRG